MEENKIIVLKKSDLKNNLKNLLIHDVAVCDFKEESLSNEDIKKANQIFYIDNNELLVLKSRDADFGVIKPVSK